MRESSPHVQEWSQPTPPSEAEIRRLLDAERLSCYRWSNAPGDVYEKHIHPYHKVIYVVQGSITFGLPGIGEEVVLNVGDRLDLPAGIAHAAVVGPHGVICLEAHHS